MMRIEIIMNFSKVCFWPDSYLKFGITILKMDSFPVKTDGSDWSVPLASSSPAHNPASLCRDSKLKNVSLIANFVLIACEKTRWVIMIQSEMRITEGSYVAGWQPAAVSLDILSFFASSSDFLMSFYCENILYILHLWWCVTMATGE